jgi:membrane-associated protein
MEFLRTLVGFVLHLDKYLDKVMAAFGPWTYVVLFAIIFCETGLVITPFLPGDSLLFAVGALLTVSRDASPPPLRLEIVLPLLVIAAILGDTANYWIGHRVGPRVFHREDVRFLNKRHLDRTHAFYEKHGGKTIVLARFIPIIRTFAPFVAGIGAMSYPRFLAYNVVGGAVWVTLFLLLGHFFGNQPVVKRNFTLVILAIIALSLLPPAIEVLRHRLAQRRGSPPSES